MTGSKMGYPGLARLIGRPESARDQIIVSNVQVAARRRAAAAIEGVLVALRLLSVQDAVH
jgi:hypothetical protein